MTVIPAKGKLPLEAKISVNQSWICNKRSLETIETLSIITLTSNNLFLNMDLILSFNGGKRFPENPTGRFRPVCIVVPEAAPFFLILNFCKRMILIENFCQKALPTTSISCEENMK